MADVNEECFTLDQFRLWKVDDLKRFCRSKGLPVGSKRKEELVALAFTASIQNLPTVLTAAEENKVAQSDYVKLLNIGESTIPDPFTLSGWLNEADGIKLWPPCMYIDIAEYLIEKDQKELLFRLRNDYKEGKAFSYFASQKSWIHDTYYHPIDDSSPLCLVKSECTPSQNIRGVPHKLWVCLSKKDGKIQTAYCSCFAGLGSTCNHVAAQLFKLDYAWQNGLTSGNVESCTSKSNMWIKPTSKVLEPVKLSDLVFGKPHFQKKSKTASARKASRLSFTPARSSKDTADPTTNQLVAAFYQTCPDSAAFQYAYPHILSSYPPEHDLNVLSIVDVETSATVPMPLIEFGKNFSSCDSMLAHLPQYTPDECSMLEQCTRNQSQCAEWMLQRNGRITASLGHNILSWHRKGKAESSEWLLQTVLGMKTPDPNLPALKYGRQKEPEAVECYVANMKQHHINLKVDKCGLFVVPNLVYIGASPDRLVECDCCGAGLLEVKCPISQAGKSLTDVNVSYIKNGKLNQNHNYYTQIQQQMGVTCKSWCDFVMYINSDNIFIERIKFNSNLWEEIRSACSNYFQNIVAHALIDPEVITI